MTKFSGRTSLYKHKRPDWREYEITDDDPKALERVWVLDAQLTTCPVEVENQVKDLWILMELGNDNYVYKTSIRDLEDVEDDGLEISKVVVDVAGNYDRKMMPVKTDLIVEYLRAQGVGDDERVFIHWWW